MLLKPGVKLVPVNTVYHQSAQRNRICETESQLMLCGVDFGSFGDLKAEKCHFAQK